MVAYEFGISDLFTWASVAEALSGGALLGCSVVFKTSCLSGVLGISNYTKRLVYQTELKRVFFIVGMVLGSLFLALVYKGTEPLPPPGSTATDRTKLFLRLAFGAFIVGFGAAQQHGCTSGHGLTGLARLSPRSWVAVPVFMVVGLITGTVLQSASAFPPIPPAADDPEWYVGTILAASMAFLLFAVAVLLRVVEKVGSDQMKVAASLCAEFLIGATFGSGLLISGMAKPSKVATFLDVLSGHWDLSLAFVMIGGLCVTFPYFQAVDHFKIQKKSFLADSGMDLPPANRMPDWGLVFGACCFGFGWGVCGVCPGPIWVNLGADPSSEMVIALIALSFGLCFKEVVAFVRTLTCGRNAAVNDEATVLAVNEKKSPQNSQTTTGSEEASSESRATE
eukprot:CAMPEP_0206430540 /NCGR_PEP_ID=MMETSP0324_2-20121206/6872_1 /ASSEMBLY_ACC=CAM_ASM_000836 /TAXON_ID=2866 /ORGANISM="Crypthecodinium cohnii, Strain Seligo" /LENGTH=393 /DNA_ID=CAMNT_0053896381 /DNA_START=156 /DNA_END=1337 /DNA_ORIENTATION=-